MAKNIGRRRDTTGGDAAAASAPRRGKIRETASYLLALGKETISQLNAGVVAWIGSKKPMAARVKAPHRTARVARKARQMSKAGKAGPKKKAASKR
jgi:hypothetical protein